VPVECPFWHKKEKKTKKKKKKKNESPFQTFIKIRSLFYFGPKLFSAKKIQYGFIGISWI